MIKLINLKHRWLDDDWIIDIPYLEIAEGKSLALVGLSGCGKSTLIALLAAWVTPIQGEIWINGIGLHLLNSRERTEWRLRYSAWQGQHHHFFESLSIPENLSLFYNLATNLNLLERFSSAQAHYGFLLDRVQLNDKQLRQSPRNLSLGELQRFQVIRACLQKASLTLLDEPSSHLDQYNRHKLIQALFSHEIRIQQNYLIIATHDLELAHHCDQVIYLDRSIQSEPSSSLAINRNSNLIQDQAELQRLERITAKHNSSNQQGLKDQQTYVSLPQFSASYFAWLQFIHEIKLYGILMIAACLALLLPIFVSQQITHFQFDLNSRAQETPLVISGLNSEYDLFFSSIYFIAKPQNELKVAQTDLLFAQGLKASPLVIAPQVKQSALVGTDRSYYQFRKFNFVKGHPPERIGEVCLSNTQAQAMNLDLGMSVQTSPSDFFQLDAPYPINLEIVGIFETQHPSDQDTYFTTLETAWAARGHAHSHRQANGPVNASLIIDQNLKKREFHIHSDPDTLPISMLLTHDESDQKKSLLKARLRKNHQNFSVLDSKSFSKRTLDFTEEVRQALKPLFALASTLSLALILLILGFHYQSRKYLRDQLLILGMTKSKVFKLSLFEYMLFIFFCLLILTLGLVLIETYILSDSTWIKTLL